MNTDKKCTRHPLDFPVSKKKFLEFSYTALRDKFPSRVEFDSFFDSIEGEEQKNLFLNTATFYLFLVKQGDWIVDIAGSDPIVDYLTETYKYIGIFSLIESQQQNNFIDFYTYLSRDKSKVEFPIEDKEALESWYHKYKKEFGSTQQAIGFFNSLNKESQEALIQKLEIENTKPTIENLSKYLYELRSKFVHEAKLVLNMSAGTAIGKTGKKVVVCKLSIEDLMNFFEEGLIRHFKV
jgi:hypothetical protein